MVELGSRAGVRTVRAAHRHVHAAGRGGRQRGRGGRVGRGAGRRRAGRRGRADAGPGHGDGPARRAGRRSRRGAGVRAGDGQLAGDGGRAGRRPGRADARAAVPRAGRRRRRAGSCSGWMRSPSASPPGGSARAAPARSTRCRQAAGILCLAKPGDPVTAGQPLFELHTDTPEKFPAALADLAGAVDDRPAGRRGPSPAAGPRHRPRRVVPAPSRRIDLRRWGEAAVESRSFPVIAAARARNRALPGTPEFLHSIEGSVAAAHDSGSGGDR